MNRFTSTAALLALAGLALAVAVLAWWGLRRQRPVPAPAPAPPQRAGTASDASDRVKRDIEQRVQSLRRARDHAERWVPPAVDAVGPKRKKTAAAPPDWADTSFADTTIPDDEPPEPPAPFPRRPAR